VLFTNWLRFYQYRVYSTLEDERPPDDIVPYDILLEDWLDDLERRKERDRKKNKRGDRDHFRME